MSALGATEEPWRVAMLLKGERLIAEVEEIAGPDKYVCWQSS